MIQLSLSKLKSFIISGSLILMIDGPKSIITLMQKAPISLFTIMPCDFTAVTTTSIIPQLIMCIQSCWGFPRLNRGAPLPFPEWHSVATCVPPLLELNHQTVALHMPRLIATEALEIS